MWIILKIDRGWATGKIIDDGKNYVISERESRAYAVATPIERGLVSMTLECHAENCPVRSWTYAQRLMSSNKNYTHACLTIFPPVGQDIRCKNPAVKQNQENVGRKFTTPENKVVRKNESPSNHEKAATRILNVSLHIPPQSRE